MTTKPLLVIRVLPAWADEVQARLASDFDIRACPDDAGFFAVLDRLAPRIEAVGTNGMTGLSSDRIAAMPRLRLIHCRSSGHENIALHAARDRGIPVSGPGGANAHAVADHALALMLGLIRQVPQMDGFARRGQRSTAALRSARGLKAGILGPGRIGLAIGARCAAFGMPLGQCARTSRDIAGWARFSEAAAIAAWADVLFVAAPGGDETRHMIGAAELSALGSEGLLVNISRGEVVDTAALTRALRDGTIAGAGLDVWEGEPALPPALAGAPNTLFSPHVGGVSPDAQAAMTEALVDSFTALIQGRPIPNCIS